MTRALSIALVLAATLGFGLVVTGATVANRPPAKIEVEGAYFTRSQRAPDYAREFSVWKGPSGTPWFVAGFALLASAAAVTLATRPTR